MKITNKRSSTILCLLAFLVCFSCKTEDDFISTPSSDVQLAHDSVLADLMKRVAVKDGSLDNIIDKNSSLSIELPISVTVNAVEVEIIDSNGFRTVEDIIEASDEDEDEILINYPISVILADYSRMELGSDDELQALTDDTTNSENDEDIECVDFQYPLTVSFFNENSELFDILDLNSDKEVFDFIRNLDQFSIVSVEFPITVVLSDASTQQVNSVNELSSIIENADGTCDEDDDIDFDDDDCDSCTTSQLNFVLQECDNWGIARLERDGGNCAAKWK
jgi:hypothetical protein